MCGCVHVSVSVCISMRDGAVELGFQITCKCFKYNCVALSHVERMCDLELTWDLILILWP